MATSTQEVLGTSSAATSGKHATGDRSPALAAYTPGPWVPQQRHKGAGHHVTAGKFQIFLGTHEGAPIEEWEANARLIAAAPDFFTAAAGDDWNDECAPEYLRPVSWLKTLLIECRKPEVFNALAGDDPDACASMLLICEMMQERLTAAIAKATGAA